MRILGIDPGLTRCGVGIISVGAARKLTFEHVEVLVSAADLPIEQRLVKIGGALARILDGPEPPDQIALERVFAQDNVASVMGVAQISGVALFLAAQRSIPIRLYTPNEIKLQVTGYGAADKTQVTTMVTRLLGLAAPPKPADAADALALAITHAWQLARSGAVGSSAGNGVENIPVTGNFGALTPAQQAWAAAEQKAGRRRRGMRR
ncbi:MAG: crossover junction endodeoxyribonuclease RuvC [Microbacteriaceae bacterium]|nr:crossover junction endodeoxyribonuclease RuvC [Microbacteriaceae bacterium]